ncbi:MAG: DUF484 family protein [Rhodocyclaceae bacterium]|jgi:uncharacterized protein
MQKQDVIQYLRNHPDFFQDKAELLTELQVAHPTSGQVISLGERQLLAMRDKLAHVQDKLGELVAFGEENDVISAKVHRLAISLMQAGDFTALTRQLYLHLQDDFAVPHVALRAWGFGVSHVAPEFTPLDEALRPLATELRRPYCGTAARPEHSAWFGEMAPHVRSVALVPLRQNDAIVGILAMGSEDTHRFYPDMGTLYIERIGEMAAAALQRALS